MAAKPVFLSVNTPCQATLAAKFTSTFRFVEPNWKLAANTPDEGDEEDRGCFLRELLSWAFAGEILMAEHCPDSSAPTFEDLDAFASEHLLASLWRRSFCDLQSHSLRPETPA